MKQKLCLAVAIILLFPILLLAQAFPVGTAREGGRLTWNPHGKSIAVSNQNIVNIVNVDSSIINTLPAFPEIVVDMDWNGSGDKLAIAYKTKVEIWNQPESSTPSVDTVIVPTLSPAFNWGILSIDWHPTEQKIITVTSQYVQIWNTSTGSQIDDYSDIYGTLLIAKWSFDGNKLAIGDLLGDIQIEDTLNSEYGFVEMIGGGIADIAWNPNNTTLISSSYSGEEYHEGYVERWVRTDILEGTVRTYKRSGLTSREPNIVSLSWNTQFPDLVASADAQGNVYIWDMSDSSGFGTIHEFSVSHPIADIEWSPDGTMLAYSGINRAVEIINLRQCLGIKSNCEFTSLQSIVKANNASTD